MNSDDLRGISTEQLLFELRRREQPTRGFGDTGVRDPDTPCSAFEPGTPSGQCQTDGHYMCHECQHAELCKCGQIEARCECPDEEIAP